MTTSRRTFLTGAAAAAVGVGLTPGRAWGDLYTPPNSQTVSKVLEIFMVGGASHRDTCWLEDPDAHANVTYGNWSGSWRDTTLNWSSNIGASRAPGWSRATEIS